MTGPAREAAERDGMANVLDIWSKCGALTGDYPQSEMLKDLMAELRTIERALPTAGNDREALAKLLNDALSEIAGLQEARLMAGHEPNAKLADILKRGAILASGFRRDGVKS